MKEETKSVPTMAYFLQGKPHTDLVMGYREVKVKITLRTNYFLNNHD